MRIVLLAITILIISFMFYNTWRERRRRKTFVMRASVLEDQYQIPELIQPKKPDDFRILHVFAKSGNVFASYDLFQAIAASGMQFGDMNIFHYYEEEKILFSLASATEPGEFDLSRMGDYAAIGLTLFMNAAKVDDPDAVFLKMLKTAEQLAEDLEGELLDSRRQPYGVV